MAAILHDPLTRLLAQAVVIIAASRLVGLLTRRIQQPFVIAEVVAGILLGPSLLGWVAPDVSAALFSRESLGIMQMVAQIGVVLFMFLVGLELDPKLLRGRGHTSVVISHTSILIPFLLGTGLAFYLHDEFSDPSVPMTAFALFMGAAMSITAFPVLARILTERHLLRTRVGAVTIACAAVDDVTAWCILAFVVAVARSAGIGGAVVTTGMVLVYIAVMFIVARPLLVRLAARVATPDAMTQNVVALVLMLVFVSSWATELIGVHALFGAFLFGAVMPKTGSFARALAEKLEDLVLVVFMPLFFAYSGLRTQIGLLDSASDWIVCGVIIVIACVGKFGGSAIPARLTGLSWRESGALGLLMNTRGLMELIVLNIGLDLGVISPTIFSMMILMALVTTFMATPILERVYPQREMARDLVDLAEPAAAIGAQASTAPAAADQSAPATRTGYRILLCVSHAGSAGGLFTMASALTDRGEGSRLYALHLVPSTGRGSSRLAGGADESGLILAPVIERAAAAQLPVRSLSFISAEPARDITQVADVRQVDLVLLGWHKPVLSQTHLGGVVHDVMSQAPATVGVFVDRGLSSVKRVLVPYLGSPHDRAALALAHRLHKNAGAEVVILHVVKPNSARRQPGAADELMTTVFGDDAPHVIMNVVEHRSPAEAALQHSGQGFDLVVVGVGREWGLSERRVIGLQPEMIIRESPTSLLIVRDAASRARGLPRAALTLP
ncbi:MAG TPA: cation:proton antiporter [Kofleriaceae bacterium]|nr:cation:proton antiporter [Kofleriaceae bacterium]